MGNGIIASLFEKRTLDENTGWGLINKLRNGSASWSSPAGVTVTPDRALQLTAVFAAVRILAESLAALPLPMYRRLKRGKERDYNHPLYTVLHDQANPMMTAFELRETMMGHLCTWGNAYAEIETDSRGNVAALWPLRPDMTEMRRVKGEIYYVTQLPECFGGVRKALAIERVFHITGLSSDGMNGLSPVKYARNALGLSAATEQFGSAFFGNGAKPGGVLEHPETLSEQAQERLKNNWEDLHSGLDNAQRVAILEEGMKYTAIGIPPEDAQFLETRKFQVSEIARMFRIPPHMLADLERATFSNIEQMSLEFVIYSLMPWIVRWEQKIRMKLFLERERSTHLAEFLVDGLLRGDTTARYQAYHQAWQDGWMNWNEIREKENMNPIEKGDVHYVPLNMIPAEMAGEMRSGQAVLQSTLDLPLQTREKVVENGGEREVRAVRSLGTRRRLMISYRPILEEAAGRVMRREVHDLIAGAKRNFRQRSYSDFSDWLDAFFIEHQEFIIKNMSGVVQAYAELIAAEAADEAAFADMTQERLMGFVRRYLEALASRHVLDSRERVDKVLADAQTNGAEPVEALESGLADWEESRSASIGKREATQLNGAISKFVYLASGVAALYWRTYNDSCPYCKMLNGKRVAMNEFFLLSGEELLPEDAEKFTSGRDVGHPPAHDGCDCMVSAF